jgi:hypothetical protein
VLATVLIQIKDARVSTCHFSPAAARSRTVPPIPILRALQRDARSIARLFLRLTMP